MGPAKVAAFAFVLVLTLPFVSMFTRVNAGGTAWAFTLGFPSGFIAFSDIADAQMTRTNFWEGFRIHWTIWHGWVWNVAGYGAVMIQRREGGVITVGTDDPRASTTAYVEHRFRRYPTARTRGPPSKVPLTCVITLVRLVS